MNIHMNELHSSCQHGVHNTWSMWKNVNGILDVKELCREIYIYTGPSHITFEMLILIKNMMNNNKSSWRTYYYLLLKPTCQFLLCRANGWSTWSCVRIHGLCSQTKNKWSRMSSLHVWLKPWNNMYVNLGFMCYNNNFF
jgi:hypothetical protein